MWVRISTETANFIIMGLLGKQSLVYKDHKDLKYQVEITAKDGKVNFAFAVDGGKFGTWEQVDEYEVGVKELLDILQKSLPDPF